MEWTKLPTNYQDAIWSGNRKYRQISNPDGTVSFEDVTEYTQKENSFFGANDANAMNSGMNQIAENMNEMSAEFTTWTDEVVKVLEGNIGAVLPTLQIQAITIPTSGWVSDSTSGCYRLAIANDIVKSDCVVEVNLDLTSLEQAGEIGLKAVTDSYNGGFYLYAETKPTTKMTGSVVILGNSVGLDTTVPNTPVPDSTGTYLTVKEDEQ